MPVQYILANLLANTEGAVGVMFLDDEGETVDMAAAELPPWDLKLMGAYLGIYLRRVAGFLPGLEGGTPERLHIEKEGFHVHVRTLPEGYYIALVQKRPALAARAHRSLERAAREIGTELFDY